MCYFQFRNVSHFPEAYEAHFVSNYTEFYLKRNRKLKSFVVVLEENLLHLAKNKQNFTLSLLKGSFFKKPFQRKQQFVIFGSGERIGYHKTYI